MPFGPPFVNVYLVAQQGGYTLIDTAIGTNDAFVALDQGLETIGVEWKQIRQIVISHLHPDHIGLAPRLRELSKAPVLMNRHDSILLDQITGGSAKSEELRSALLRGGVPLEFVEGVTAAYDKIARVFPRFTPDQFLKDGDALQTDIGEWQVIITPGHSPGHLCLYNRDQGLLFSGDQVIEEITPHIGWLPDRDSLAEFLQSMDRLSRLDVRLILPSHGLPFSGLQPWVERTVKHHEDRCRQLEILLAGGPQTTAQLVASIWKRQLPPLDYQLGFTEILSHLEYLAARHRVVLEETPVQKWRTA